MVRPAHSDGFFYGRVWKRWDDDHVVVIDCGKNITLYRDDELVADGYTGQWEWLHHPGNDYGNPERWSRMTGLRHLKKYARTYHASFGGRGAWGRWTKEEQREALANPRRHKPR